MTVIHAPCTKKTCIAAATTLLLAFYAQAQTVEELTSPDTASVSVGAAAVSGDPAGRSIYGQYNGQRLHDGYGLLDFEYVKRDAQGNWTKFSGANLGLDTRELNGEISKQGEWRYGFDYSELVKRDIRTVNTNITGIGTSTPTFSNALATPGTGVNNVDMSQERKRLGLVADRQITDHMKLSVEFKDESKHGARLSGMGFACGTTWVNAGVCGTGSPWALLMVPEPVNTNSRQLDAKLSYSDKKLSYTVGYYGSFFSNSDPYVKATGIGSLNSFYAYDPATGLYGAGTAMTDNGIKNVLGLAKALPPDNHAHNFYFSGNYAIDKTTKATWKASYTTSLQNQTFAPEFGTSYSGRTSLDGRINKTLLQGGIFSRPTSDLSWLANVRYEDKNDKTPIDYYNVEGADTTRFTNSSGSNTRMVAKLEGSYRLDEQHTATLGRDYEQVRRDLPYRPASVAGISYLRGDTREATDRIELRRLLSDDFTGSIAYMSSHRAGSDLFSLGSTNYGTLVAYNTVAATAVTPAYLNNRNREKLRALFDWAPQESLTLQAMVELGSDRTESPSTRGLRRTEYSLYNLDATYQVTNNWSLSGYVSKTQQNQDVNAGLLGAGYRISVQDKNTATGMLVKGKLNSALEVGGGFAYVKDKIAYPQQTGSYTATNQLQYNTSLLPDVVFSTAQLNVFAKYALDKNADVTLNAMRQKTRLDEWTWTGFAYSDGTTVGIQPRQTVNYVGVRYTYRMQ